MNISAQEKRWNKISGIDIFLAGACLVMIGIVLLYYFYPPFWRGVGLVVPALRDFALRNGYVGAFVVTFLCNGSLIPLPYGSILFFLGGVGLNPFLLGLLSGLAASLGQTVAYFIGRGAGTLMKSEAQQQKFLKVKNFILRRPRLTPFLIFLFGLTPLPDDIILIPLGMIKYSFWKALIPDSIGKIGLTFFAVYAGKVSFSLSQQLTGSGREFWAAMAVAVLTVLIIYLTIKIKWENIIKD